MSLTRALKGITCFALLLAPFYTFDTAAAQNNSVSKAAATMDSNIDLFLEMNSQYLISLSARRKLELQHLNASTCLCSFKGGHECNALQHPKIVTGALQTMLNDRQKIHSQGYLHYLGKEVGIDFKQCGYTTKNANTGLTLIETHQIDNHGDQEALISVGHQVLELGGEAYRVKLIGQSITSRKIDFNEDYEPSFDNLVCSRKYQTRPKNSVLPNLLLSNEQRISWVENPNYQIPASIRRMYLETDVEPNPTMKKFVGSRFFEASTISLQPTHSASCGAGCVRKIVESTIASLSFWKRRCETCRAQGTEAILAGDRVFINEELAHTLHGLELQGGSLSATQLEAIQSSENYRQASNRRAISRGRWRGGNLQARTRYLNLGRSLGFIPGLDRLSNSRFVEFNQGQLQNLGLCRNSKSLAALPYRSVKHLCDPNFDCRTATNCLAMSLLTGERACPDGAIACGREADSHLGVNTKEFAFLDRENRPINEPMSQYADRQIALDQVTAHEVGHWFGLSHISTRDAAGFVPPGWRNIMTDEMDGESNVCVSRVNAMLANEAMNALWPHRLEKDELNLLRWKE